MKLFIENDKQNGPGFALLKSNDSSVEPDGLMIKIESRDAKPYLGANGWTSSDTSLTPDAVRKDGALLVISIGPDVVRHLREATYKVSLIGASGTSESSRVSSKDILMPRSNQSGLVAGASGVKRVQVSGGGGSLDYVIAQNNDDAVTSTTATSAEVEASPLSATEESTPIVRTSNKLIPMVIALVAVMILAGGGYFAYTKFFAAGGSAVALDSPTSHGSDAGNLTPMEQARAFLATGPSTLAMVERAKKFWSDGHGEPGFLVMSRAAKDGDASALIEMAKIYDPVIDRPSALGMPDAKGDIAYNYYRQAQKLGNNDAAAAISGLRSWAESAAAEGNRDAGVLIRLMAMER